MPAPEDPLQTTARSADAPHAGAPDDDSTRPGSVPPGALFDPRGSTIAVPGYDVRGLLARGGMGVVYTAWQLNPAREVAIKTLIPGRSGEARTARRFVTESQVTAALQHPGVPPVFEVGQLADGRPYLVMKLIRGDDLSALLKRRASPATELPRFLAAFERVCHTVGYAHARGVLHRDLKPANVMVGEFDEVQVMDWGLARAAGGEEADRVTATHSGALDANDQTQAGVAMGTPAFMAPEQARGEPVDARADVFALGGLLAVILTDVPPFVGAGAVDTVTKAARADLGACFAQLDACGADAGLIALAKRCLAPKADDRPADGRAVADAVAAHRASVEARLREAEADRAAEAAKAVEAERRAEAEAREAREQKRRRRAQAWLAASVAVLLFGVGAFAWWRDSQATERAAERKAAAAKAEADDANRLKAEAEQRAAFAKTEAEQKLALQKAEADRAAALERTRAGVESGLKFAAELRAQHRFREAGEALDQAENLLKAGGADDLKPRLALARADLAFAHELDAIRARKWVWVPAPDGDGGAFDTGSAATAYAAAFARRGLDVSTGDSDAIAKQIAGSPISRDIVRALDDWAIEEKNAATGAKVMAVARGSAPADLRANRFRLPALHRDRTQPLPLPPLAEDLTAPAALLAATLIERRGGNPGVILAIALAKYPDDFDIAFALAHWFHNRDPQRAIGYYRTARALRPEHPTVLTNLGLLLGANGERGVAVAVLKEAIKLHPEDHIAHFNLGGVYAAQERFTLAEAEYRETIRLSPKYADGHANLGAVLGRLNKPAEAVKVLEGAVVLAPNNVRVRINYGAALQSNRQPDDAIVQFRKAVELAPKFAPAHYALGVGLEAKKDLPEAHRCFREAARLDPKQYGDLLKKLPPEK